MDLGQVEAFVQVAQLRSFSKAADALFLTQPSVTARIQSLEREIGERLFLALSTVKGHVGTIFDKLGVKRRTEALARSRELGLL